MFEGGGVVVGWRGVGEDGGRGWDDGGSGWEGWFEGSVYGER